MPSQTDLHREIEAEPYIAGKQLVIKTTGSEWIQSDTVQEVLR